VSRVWVVSGIVIAGTGLSLAGFGYWLAGNGNCDASDLGRACVMASLATTVVGAALCVGGWLRLKRLAGGEERAEGPSWLPVAAIFALLVGGTVLLTVASPVATLPADVYGHDTPDADAAPEGFLLPDLAGHARASLVVAPGELPGSDVAVATYAGNVQVRITRFNASAIGGSANATRAADAYLDNLYIGLDRSSGASACASPGDAHWYVHTDASGAKFAWQRQNFVVQVAAPDTATRDRVAGALSI
jgi:hypothetical protein